MNIKTAYADCQVSDFSFGSSEMEKAMKECELMFRSPEWVDKDTAKTLMTEALSGMGNYNNFNPFIFDVFPRGCKFQLAREYSVAIYVRSPDFPNDLPSEDEVCADESSINGDEARYWWD